MQINNLRPLNIFLIAIAVGVGMTLMLGGVALMLWATTDVSHWLLWAVPLAPTAMAITFFLWPIAARRMDVTAAVQQQVEKDLQWFKEIY